MRFPRRWYPVVVAWNTVGFTTAKVYINPRNRAAKLCRCAGDVARYIENALIIVLWQTVCFCPCFSCVFGTGFQGEKNRSEIF